MTDKFNLLSEEQLAAISSGKLWNFHGGVHPQENKTQSNQQPIDDAGIAATLIIPIEHKGHIPELLVQVGDVVLKGQALTKVYSAMVVHHASSSGTVVAIEKRCDLHPSGLSVLSVVIQTDGLDRAIDYVKPPAYQSTDPALLIEQIQQAGIVGLGGAGFPSHLKLVQHGTTKLLLINAAECEPYITADDRLMQEQAEEIIAGIAVVNHILQPQLTIIAIEDNKPEAIASLQEALQGSPHQGNIQLRIIPTIYPSGSGKQLIEIITGQQTPVGKHSMKLGIVMLNVGTVFAIKEAIIDGKPLTSRIVTLTGDSLQKKGNVSVRIGTPIQYLLDRYWVDSTAVKELIIGGPMMGFTVNNTAAPVTKTCNCILAPTIKEMPDARPEMPCIRCSECANACPATLLPQQLLWYSKSQDHQKLEQYNLSACIECGACAFVCPSHIPLVEYYRIAKAEISTAKSEAKKAEVARLRHENREARLIQAKLDRQAKHKEAAAKRKAQMQAPSGGADLIADALARANAKKANDSETQSTTAAPAKVNDAVAAAIVRAKAKKATTTDASTESEIDPKKAAVAAALARAKAKKAAQAAKNADTTTESTAQVASGTDVDPKKAAVVAAIARAKAKKAAQAAKNADATTTETAPTAEVASDTDVDPKKAAVVAAIARAKAKKAAQAAKNADATTTETAPTAEVASDTDVDPKKAAVVAAIARAKAKKAAQAAKNADTTTESTAEVASDTDVDPKKAAVAAAIARAKAKKAAQAAKNADATTTETAPTAEVASNTDVDPKKAAVAAAIARAKAKKAAQAEKTQSIVAEPDNSEAIKQRELRKEQARLRKQEKADAQEQQQTQADAENATQPEPSAADIKKAKIAAAIARAKAKKANLAKDSASEVANEEQK